MIQFTCPSCSKPYKVKPELAGKKAKCKCGNVMQIPAAEQPAELEPLVEEPLLDDPLGSFPDPAGASSDSYDPLFDDALPTGGQVPTMPTQLPAMPAPTVAAAAAPQPAASAPTEKAESREFGTGTAILLGTGISGIGAAVWAGIAIATGYEVAWIAIGVGIGVGAGMAIAHNLSDHIDDLLGGVIASIWAILGIVGGKYIFYRVVAFPALQELAKLGDLAELIGTEEITFGVMFSPFDLLFFGLAVASAYKLGSGFGLDD